MTKRFLFFPIIILIFFSLNLLASDNPEIDSLINVLKKSKEDTNKIFLYNQISKKYVATNPDKALIYANKGLKLSKKLQFDKGIALSNKNMGIGYYYQGSYNNALIEYTKALDIYKKIKNKQQIVKLLNNIGILYHYQGKYDKAFNYYTK